MRASSSGGGVTCKPCHQGEGLHASLIIKGRGYMQASSSGGGVTCKPCHQGEGLHASLVIRVLIINECHVWVYICHIPACI